MGASRPGLGEFLIPVFLQKGFQGTDSGFSRSDINVKNPTSALPSGNYAYAIVGMGEPIPPIVDGLGICRCSPNPVVN
jgi:hypothetical protein